MASDNEPVDVPITHAAILFFHDDKRPQIVRTTDIEDEDGKKIEPTDDEDFGPKRTHFVKKRCPRHCRIAHRHDAYRRAYILLLSGKV